MNNINKWLLCSTIVLGVGCVYLGSLVLTNDSAKDVEAAPQLAQTIASMPGASVQESRVSTVESAAREEASSLPHLSTWDGESVRQLMGELTKSANEQMKRMREQRAASQYADLIKELALNPSDADRLIELLALDAVAKIPNREEIRDRATFERAMQEQERERNAAIKKLLGPERYGQFSDYSKYLNEHEAVAQYRALLAATRLELPSDNTQKRLVTIIGEERMRVPAPKFGVSKPNSNPLEDHNRWTAEFTSRVMQRTVGLLAEPQRQALESVLATGGIGLQVE